LGAREAIELFMRKHGIAILFLQETKISQDYQDNRATHTWYFSGSAKTRDTAVFEAGVTVVVQNKFVKHITEVVPWTDRIISITLQAAMPLTFIGAYAVPAKSTDKT
jgi:hypothetical protein